MEIVLQSVEAVTSANTPAAGTAEAAAARRTVAILVGIDIPGGTAAVGTDSSADTLWVAGLLFCQSVTSLKPFPLNFSR